VDEHRPGGDEPVDRADRLADPFGALRQGRDGDVGARGTQTPEGMLPAYPELGKERFQ
jgi:hypothetical protein